MRTIEEIRLEEELILKLCENITLDRLEEIFKAEQEGRVVVLPCKEGTTVYRLTENNKTTKSKNGY